MMTTLAFLIGFGSACAVTFKEANDLLYSGDASHAASAYEALIDQGVKSSALYANLGRALQQQGKTAAASLNYYRALVLDPQRIEARQGLAELVTTAGLLTFTPRWTQSIIERVPTLGLLILGEAFFWVGAFLLTIVIFRSQRTISSLCGSGCLFLVGALFLGISWFGDPRIVDAHLAIITKEKSELALSQPVETSAHVASLLPGSPVIVLSERGDWDYCQLPNGANAWIPSSSLSFVNPDHIAETL